MIGKLFKEKGCLAFIGILVLIAIWLGVLMYIF